MKARGQSVTFRLRHKKAEPVLQIYEASFSYCPQNCTFFTSRVNVIPQINDSTIQAFVNSSSPILVFNESFTQESIGTEIEAQAKKYYKETKLKDAQLFNGEVFRTIKFVYYKWK